MAIPSSLHRSAQDHHAVERLDVDVPIFRDPHCGDGGLHLGAEQSVRISVGSVWETIGLGGGQSLSAVWHRSAARHVDGADSKELVAEWNRVGLSERVG